MTQKKSENKADIKSDYLTLDGVAKYLSLSRMTVYKLINDEEADFPKGLIVVKSEVRPRKLYKRKDIAKWLDRQMSSPKS